MENHGVGTISAILDDLLVYRNLEPMDPRLPRFADSAARAGVASHAVPRKSQPDYARVMVALLHAAHELAHAGGRLQRLVYVGDTRMNDGTAFLNLCRAGNWDGMAFIGSETRDEACVDLVTENGSTLYLANRWTMVEDFDTHCRSHGFPIDVTTAVVLDLDKTLLGARGRNDHVIDGARVAAVRQTVAELLGTAFDIAQFESTYNLLNRPEFHPFTSDNQDYLAYVCLILGTNLFTLRHLVEAIRSGQMRSFAQFIGAVETRSQELPQRLQSLHSDIYERVRAGDPTPFKTFRYNEYRTTVGRMGQLRRDAHVSALLAHEIVLTYEVCEIANRWREDGALLFGLSDKPDEASMPTPALAAEGFEPIHRTVTHLVGDGALSLSEVEVP